MHAPTESSIPPRGRNLGLRLGLAALLVLGLCFIYGRVGRFDFVTYDDDRYVTANDFVQDGLTADGMRWALTATAASNWHPVTWISHMLDVELFDGNAGGHHAMSVLLFTLSVLLLYALVLRWSGRALVAFLAAALFAWHPMRVESVAWIAERKDVLSGLFGLAALWSYTLFVERRSVLRYLAVFLCVALALASKPTLVTLPFLLLVLDAWPLRRRDPWRTRILEKLPLFALAIGAALVTLRLQGESGARALAGELPLGLRLENAFASLAVYVGEFLTWSASACLVPHEALLGPGAAMRLLPAATAGGLLVVLLLGFGWRLRQRAPALLASSLWVLGSLVPMSGLVQVGYQGHADRYTYWPFLGLAIALAFAVGALLERPGRLRTLALFACCVGLLGLAVSAHVATAPWHDSRALWTHCAVATEPNFLAENNLGNVFAREGDTQAALLHFERSVEFYPGTAPDPESSTRWMNLGTAQLMLGKTERGIASLRTSVSLDPDTAEPRLQLATALSRDGRDRGAIRQLRRALEGDPGSGAAAAALAQVLSTSRDDSLRNGREALRLAKDSCQATEFRDVRSVAALAAAHAELGSFEQAVRWQERVLASFTDTSGPPEAFERDMRARLDAYRAGQPWRKSP